MTTRWIWLVPSYIWVISHGVHIDHAIDRENQAGGAETPLSSSRGFSLLPDVEGPREGPRVDQPSAVASAPYHTSELGWHPVGTADRMAA
jgi:hypothetical protein